MVIVSDLLVVIVVTFIIAAVIIVVAVVSVSLLVSLEFLLFLCFCCCYCLALGTIIAAWRFCCQCCLLFLRQHLPRSLAYFARTPVCRCQWRASALRWVVFFWLIDVLMDVILIRHAAASSVTQTSRRLTALLLASNRITFAALVSSFRCCLLLSIFLPLFLSFDSSAPCLVHCSLRFRG